MIKRRDSESYLAWEDYIKLAKQKEWINFMIKTTRQSYQNLLMEV